MLIIFLDALECKHLPKDDTLLRQMKLLNGTDLAAYIKQRQAQQVNNLRQNRGLIPRLAIVVTVDNPITDVYLKLKARYGSEIGIEVDVHRVKQTEIRSLLGLLSSDDSVQAIIVQLPLEDKSQTDEIVNLVVPEKDVDGLGSNPGFEPATPLAILWLLSGYNIDLSGKNILLVGKGKLVGKPLEKILIAGGTAPAIADKDTQDLKAATLDADIIITATGVRGLIKPDMLKPGVVVVDAGVASEGGKTYGDVDPDVYELCDDITITPLKGGVGPLTVCALFENVIRAAEKTVEAKDK
ncbi:MAG: bifunctional methylenetetrahydrofolate dehydrogenase/methenyltetrahydrofolate cyclohydrolase FolD [Candidatus Saccharimonadales bacterium]